MLIGRKNARSRSSVGEIRRLYRRRRILGLIVLVGVIVGTPLAVLKPNPLHQPQKVRVIFDEAVGISIVQRDVRVAGVRVGRIGSVRRVGEDAEVELLIDEEIGEIYADATADLRPHAPYEGTAFIDLDPGSPSAGALGDEPIPKSQTTTYVGFDQALRAFDQPTREAFKEIMRELAPAIGRAGQNGISELLENAPELMRNSIVDARAAQGPHGDELRELTGDIAATVDAIAGENERLGRTISSTRLTLDAFAVDGLVPFDQILADAPETLAEIRSVDGVAEDLIGRSEELAGPLIPMLQELTLTATAGAPLLRDIRPSAVSLPPVLEEIRGWMEAGAAVQPEVERLVDAFSPTAQTLRTSLMPFLVSEDALGIPTYMGVASALSVLTDVLMPFETPEQNEMGSGHALRGVLDLVTGGNTGGQPLPIPCSAIEALNPEFASLASLSGLCTP